jgi:hypothetical protein
MDKLFVLVRDDLSKSQQAVQGGHAVAEYLRRVPTSWNNGTLVYLSVKNEIELEDWADKLTIFGIKWAGFREPDRDNELTAISVVHDERFFKKLKLLDLE